jgi:hypothetical protein
MAGENRLKNCLVQNHLIQWSHTCSPLHHSHRQCKLKYLFFLFFPRKIGKLEQSKLHRNFTYDPKIPMGH